MKRFKVTGMMCAVCAGRVESCVSALDGVVSCAVNLLLGELAVEGEVTASEVIRAVKAAGYGAKEYKAESDFSETVYRRPVIMRLLISACIYLPLFYISMGANMWSFPLPRFLAESHILTAALQGALALAVMTVNRRFFIDGFMGVIRKAPNMDTLVALGSGASFVYSLFMLIFTAVGKSGVTPSELLHGLYFDSAAMILVLITVGKTLEATAKDRSADAIRSLRRLTPPTATVLRGGKEEVIPTSELTVGDIFILRPGSNIPADGRVVCGASTVDESALSGESMPRDVGEGEEIFSGTVNLSGYLECRAERVGEDTAISGVIRLVDDAVSTKAPIARIADKVSAVFVPAVMLLAISATLGWLILGGVSFGYALARGISVLVISCPCALGLATPVAITVGSGVGARHGILFKNAEALELAGRAKTVILDKTGTLTLGKPRVTDVIPFGDTDARELISFAYGVEKYSEHPLARAVVEYAEENGASKKDVTDFVALPGSGVRANTDLGRLRGGSLEFIKKEITVSEETEQTVNRLSDEGKTPLIFILGDTPLGIIAVADEIKPDAKEGVAALRSLGLRVVMLTGDSQRCATAVATQLGIDEVISEVKPDGKEESVRRLAKEGYTVMVGDGINDAPALARADVGISFSSGTEIAKQSSGAVLVGSEVMRTVTAIRLGRRVLKTVKENLFWAFIYNTLGIPLAAGVFIPILGWHLSPAFGALSMSLSSFTVVMNALRIYFFKPGAGK